MENSFRFDHFLSTPKEGCKAFPFSHTNYGKICFFRGVGGRPCESKDIKQQSQRRENSKCSSFPHEKSEKLFSPPFGNNKNILMRLPLDGTFIALRLESLEKMSARAQKKTAFHVPTTRGPRGERRATGKNIFTIIINFYCILVFNFHCPSTTIKSSYLLRTAEYESVHDFLFALTSYISSSQQLAVRIKQ